VAVPVPLADGFDYVWTGPGPAPEPGARVEVPFGRGRRIGIVLDRPGSTDLPREKLKPAHGALDPEPLLGAELLATLRWASDYYHHPIGEVLSHALPGLLRKGRPVEPPRAPAYRLTDAGAAEPRDALRGKAARQADALARRATGPLTAAALREAGIATATFKRLVDKGWIAQAPAEAVTGRNAERCFAAAHATNAPDSSNGPIVSNAPD